MRGAHRRGWLAIVALVDAVGEDAQQRVRREGEVERLRPLRREALAIERRDVVRSLGRYDGGLVETAEQQGGVAIGNAARPTLPAVNECRQERRLRTEAGGALHRARNDRIL